MNHLALELGKVSDQELHTRMMAISKREQQTAVEVLIHLHEVSVRRLYAKKSFASLWDYTVRALGYGESQASERIKAMQLMFRTSEVKEALETGKINLTQAAMTERHLRAEEKETNSRVPTQEVKDLIVELSGKTKRETEIALYSLHPLKAETVKETIRTVTEEISEVRFPVTEETRQAIERYWQLHGRCSLSEVFTDCLSFVLKAKDPMQALKEEKPAKEENLLKSRRTLEKDQEVPMLRMNQNAQEINSISDEVRSEPVMEPEKSRRVCPDKVEKIRLDSPNREGRSRYISRLIRRMVLERSQGCCEFVDKKTGLRCLSRYLIQFDHVYPFALGGTSEASNIRVLCSAHNRHLAKTMYSVAREAPAPYDSRALSIRQTMNSAFL